MALLAAAPVRSAALLPTLLRAKPRLISTSGGLALFVINRVVDFVFLMDIFVQANTAFVDKR